jgi:type IV pilus assembly protein PilA
VHAVDGSRGGGARSPGCTKGVIVRSQKGFTLVELMIVVIIVGILAAVAIPMYRVTAERSMATEATGCLDLVREAMRVHYAEHGAYSHASFTDGAQVTAGGILGFKASDLAGRFFSAECYTFDGAPTAATFTIECDGASSTAPHASEVSNITVTIDEDGEITKTW